MEQDSGQGLGLGLGSSELGSLERHHLGALGDPLNGLKPTISTATHSVGGPKGDKVGIAGIGLAFPLDQGNNGGVQRKTPRSVAVPPLEATPSAAGTGRARGRPQGQQMQAGVAGPSGSFSMDGALGGANLAAPHRGGPVGVAMGMGALTSLQPQWDRSSQQGMTGQQHQQQVPYNGVYPQGYPMVQGGAGGGGELQFGVGASPRPLMVPVGVSDVYPGPGNRGIMPLSSVQQQQPMQPGGIGLNRGGGYIHHSSPPPTSHHHGNVLPQIGHGHDMLRADPKQYTLAPQMQASSVARGASGAKGQDSYYPSGHPGQAGMNAGGGGLAYGAGSGYEQIPSERMYAGQKPVLDEYERGRVGVAVGGTGARNQVRPTHLIHALT